MFKPSAALVAALLGTAAPFVRAMNIVITPDAGLAANPAALAAFNRAGAAWSACFTNDITVNISAGLSSNFVSPNIIGSTSSVRLPAAYNTFLGFMKTSAAADPNDAIVASLPDLAHFNYTLPSGVTFNNGFSATKANFKAVGYGKFVNLDAVYGANDATITFNSNFTFDYDNSNGVTAGTIDFQTVATHELGHALGFISSVDTIDSLKQSGSGGSIYISPLDLFRFQDNVAGKDPTTLAEFTNDPRYLDTGGSAIFDDLSKELALSTGRNTGDGLEASHWKDDALTGHYLGIMDPSITGGVMESITANDIRALDLIGYDVVPDPAMAATLAWPAMMLRRTRRRV